MGVGQWSWVSRRATAPDCPPQVCLVPIGLLAIVVWVQTGYVCMHVGAIPSKCRPGVPLRTLASIGQRQ